MNSVSSSFLLSAMSVPLILIGISFRIAYYSLGFPSWTSSWSAFGLGHEVLFELWTEV